MVHVFHEGRKEDCINKTGALSHSRDAIFVFLALCFLTAELVTDLMKKLNSCSALDSLVQPETHNRIPVVPLLSPVTSLAEYFLTGYMLPEQHQFHT
jgi:hypothetical protein